MDKCILLVFIAAWCITDVLAILQVRDDEDISRLQLLQFKKKTKGPIGMLTTANGAPVEFHESQSTINDELLRNQFLIEGLQHLNRERLPERVVHAKGTAAFGYFEVTHDISGICKANFLDTVGKKTPVAVRFSVAISERGSADTTRDTRGFAIKFYTEDGNFDIVGLSSEMFTFKDPVLFVPFAHSFGRNPVTNLPDPNSLWDFRTLRAELLHITTFINSDRGIPDGYRYMPGFAIHTYEVKNKHDESHFVRFHILPDAGIRNLNSSEGERIAGADPNYANRDLYNAIARGEFPSWTIYIQILTLHDVKNAKFDPFDITRVIPLDQYPLHEVGRLVLNRNPVNNFAENEQLAFCPGNLVPGILGGPDKVFEARRFSYKDAQAYRLGVNFDRMPVNCPFRTQALTVNRDGRGPVKDNERDIPNYYPNSFNGPVPYLAKKAPRPIRILQSDSVDNFDQAGDLYRSFSPEEQERTVANIVTSLRSVLPFIQKRTVDLFTIIDRDLGTRLYQELRANSTQYYLDLH